VTGRIDTLFGGIRYLSSPALARPRNAADFRDCVTAEPCITSTTQRTALCGIRCHSFYTKSRELRAANAAFSLTLTARSLLFQNGLSLAVRAGPVRYTFWPASIWIVAQSIASTDRHNGTPKSCFFSRPRLAAFWW
jgi:hypothetical protein